jgi:hypothetical protein
MWLAILTRRKVGFLVVSLIFISNCIVSSFHSTISKPEDDNSNVNRDLCLALSSM